MKTLIILTLVLFVVISAKPQEENTVYVCKTTSSKRYHYKKSCRGLSRCSAKVEEITLKKAKATGKTLCGWED